MTDPSEIKAIIENIKNRRDKWLLSNRRKNLITLVNLGIDQEAAFEEIYNHLSWKDYVSGPENDNHTPPIPGNIWVFGLKISNQLCYLKFQDRPSGIVMWISLHGAEYSINFPYQ